MQATVRRYFELRRTTNHTPAFCWAMSMGSIKLVPAYPLKKKV